ncbi:pilus assembly protein PilW [Pantoea sp. Ap-967]|uniref:PilW family protein n=1 Tax=Pantoea sp. Ap-967 TaxID=2608362 RepID=UPI0014238215|nr:prepilin-type N-terminal cleavage/methylation domain-containing protein [Pantoea sp. Ap-967]NIE74179.1 pilus assembly protein PilW [Pantoea sp. Ap-967]
MSRRGQGGFSLLEATLALAIGVMVLAGAGQLLISAHRSWHLQGAALRLQDDARLALLRMARDIRQAGIFGCLRLDAIEFEAAAARQAFEQPVEVGPSSLNLIVAELPGHTGAPDWTLLTDCHDRATLYPGRQANPDGFMAIPISRYRYYLNGTSLMFSRRGRPQGLAEHVRTFQVALVNTPQGQRIDLHLTLYEPVLQLEQQHGLSVALRNPVAGP